MAWKYFTDDEMRCKCGCGQVEMDEAFMRWLDDVREEFGAPMVVTSAYRCRNHPIERRKDTPGVHTHGIAADIAVSGSAAHQLIAVAMGKDVQGLGVAQTGPHNGRFIHLDLWGGTPRPTVWSY